MHADVQALFPDLVRTVALTDADVPDPLFPIEEAAVAKAVDKRKREFAMGRTCARRALRMLGVPPSPLPPQPDRSVSWPSGAVGSITHAEGLYAAVVGHLGELQGVGIDAELTGRVSRKLWRQVANDREIAWFEGAEGEGGPERRATLLFSAKEAFYKAQFCVTRSWVGFHDVELSFTDDGHFEVRVLEPIGPFYPRGFSFGGRWALLDRHVVTGLTLLRP